METNNEEKAKPVETKNEEKAKRNNEEKAKPVEREKEKKEAKGSERARVSPFKEGEKWWAPITNEEWQGWHGDETFKCKTGGWWATMTGDVYGRYKLKKDFHDFDRANGSQ